MKKNSRHTPMTTMKAARTSRRSGKVGQSAARTVPTCPVPEFVARKQKHVTFKGFVMGPSNVLDVTMNPVKRRVRMIRTCSPYFGVHKAVSFPPKKIPRDLASRWWTVTHLGTGYSMAKFIRSSRIAQLVAGAIAGWPIDWGLVTIEHAKLPIVPIVGPELVKWLQDIYDGSLEFAPKKELKKSA